MPPFLLLAFAGQGRFTNGLYRIDYQESWRFLRFGR